MAEVDWNKPPLPGPPLLHRWLAWPISVRIVWLAVHATLIGLSLLALGVKPVASFIAAWVIIGLLSAAVSGTLAALRHAWSDPARERLWLAAGYAGQGVAWTLAGIAVLLPALVGLTFGLWGLFSLPLLMMRPR